MVCCRLSYRCFWSHAESDELSGSRYVAIQRMAHAAGLADLDQQTHLCLHPKFGPWFALRCVLVFDSIEHTGPRKPQLKYPLSLSTQEYVKLAIKCAQRAPSNRTLQDAGNLACYASRFSRSLAAASQITINDADMS